MVEDAPPAKNWDETLRIVEVALVVVLFITERAVMEELAFTMMPTVDVGVMAVRPEYCQKLR